MNAPRRARPSRRPVADGLDATLAALLRAEPDDPLAARWAVLLGPELARGLRELPAPGDDEDGRAVEATLAAWLSDALPRGLLGGRPARPAPAPAGAEVALVAGHDGRLHVPEAQVGEVRAPATTLDPGLGAALAASLAERVQGELAAALLGPEAPGCAERAARRARAALSLGGAIARLVGRLEAARVLLARRPRLVLSSTWVLHGALVGPRDDGVVDTAALRTAEVDRLLAPLDLEASRTGLLVLGDAAHGLTLLRAGLAGAVQAAYLDPPFNTTGSGFDYRDRYGAAEWLCLVEDRVRLLLPLLRDDAAVFTHIDQHEKERLRLVLDRHLAFVTEIIWRIGWVSGFKSRAARFIRNHETIYHHGRSPRPFFVKRWLPHPPGYRRRGQDGPPTGPGYPLEDTWNCGPLDRLDSIQLKSFSREKVGRRELTQKNEDLLERIVLSSSREGDLVLDPFLGSGTTAAAAHKLGRRWVGLELGATQAAHARPRLARVVAGDEVGISKKLGWRGGGAFETWTLEDHALGLWTALAEDERPAAHRLALRLGWRDDRPTLALATPRLDDPGRAWLLDPAGARRPVDAGASLAALLGLRLRRRVPVRGGLVLRGDAPSGRATTLVLVKRARGATDASHAAAIAAALEASGLGGGDRLLATGLDDARPGLERAEAALEAALVRCP